jgi:hypothetical protein
MAAYWTADGWLGEFAGAASGAGKRTLNIYRVKVDGQQHEFGTLEDALAFLNEQKALAIKAAQEAMRAATEPAAKKPELKAPKIGINTRQLRAAAKDTSRSIEATYRQAAIDAELALLFAAEREVENEEIITWLM